MPRSGQEDVRSPGARNQVARAFEGARVRPSGESTAGSRAPRAAIRFDAVREAREPERSGSCLAPGPTRLTVAASSTGDHALQLRRGSANAARMSLTTLARQPSSALYVSSEGAPSASDSGCSVHRPQRRTSGFVQSGLSSLILPFPAFWQVAAADFRGRDSDESRGWHAPVAGSPTPVTGVGARPLLLVVRDGYTLFTGWGYVVSSSITSSGDWANAFRELPAVWQWRPARWRWRLRRSTSCQYGSLRSSCARSSGRLGRSAPGDC